MHAYIRAYIFASLPSCHCFYKSGEALEDITKEVTVEGIVTFGFFTKMHTYIHTYIHMRVIHTYIHTYESDTYIHT